MAGHNFNHFTGKTRPIKTTLSSVLSQTVRGPKMDHILDVSEQICKKYRKKFMTVKP